MAAQFGGVLGCSRCWFMSMWMSSTADATAAFLAASCCNSHARTDGTDYSEQEAKQDEDALHAQGCSADSE